VLDRANKGPRGMDGLGGMESGGGGGGQGVGNSILEMSIPGLKVGLIIGRGGETIRQLQVSLGRLYSSLVEQRPVCLVVCSTSTSFD
jgi:hypothetical protein